MSAFDIVVLPFGLRAQKLGCRPTLISFAIEFYLAFLGRRVFLSCGGAVVPNGSTE